MKKIISLLILVLTFTACDKNEESPFEELVACFGHNPNELNDGEVQFANCSEGANSYYWDFGDGKTSTEKEPLHIFDGDFPYNVTLIAYNGNETDTVTKPIYDDIMVYKPNIYIYPENNINLCVTISFPMGGEIVESIPAYAEQWCVNIDTTGKIDNQYDYLFYESKQPNTFQYKKGWCVARKDINSFFKTNMKQYNFSDTEINDFIEYWMPLLDENNYYMVYPQTNKIIDEIIKLNFSIQPDNVSRLFYGVLGVDEYTEIEKPVINPFNRNGFHIIEWGVFRK
uniref:PKD domain-containing protein n=1 Tax=uncultured Draconibacterium sp. TaxID=1573823 RepID=UPI00321785BD